VDELPFCGESQLLGLAVARVQTRIMP